MSNPKGKYVPARQFGWLNNPFLWPYAFEYNGEMLGRASSIASWTENYDAEAGSVYTNADNSVVLFIYAEV